MQPKYKIIIKKDDGTFETKRVFSIEMNDTLPDRVILTATFLPIEDDINVKTIVKPDEFTVWLYQSTNTFDAKGSEIYHGDYLKDTEQIIYEVMYASGSYFIVKNDNAVMLLDNVTKQLEVIGNVIENSDLIKIDTTPLDAVADNV